MGHTPAAEVRQLGEIVIVDTGACYGGKLSAYCPETGELRQVPGLQSWSALSLEQRVPGGPAPKEYPSSGATLGVLSKPVAILVQSGGHHVNA